MIYKHKNNIDVNIFLAKGLNKLSMLLSNTTYSKLGYRALFDILPQLVRSDKDGKLATMHIVKAALDR